MEITHLNKRLIIITFFSFHIVKQYSFRLWLSMKKVLVTGGAGFIGYHLSKFLLNKGFNLTILDNFSDYYSRDLKWLNAKELEQLGATIIKGDILKKSDLLKALSSNCDVVFHLAAQPGVRFSTINPEQSLRINIEGTAQVLSVCKEWAIKKIVLASSSSVFGEKEYLPIDESHPKKPISFYGVSKLATERLVDVYRRLYSEMDISIIRPFTVIGARQRPDMAINSFVSRALNDRKITIYGDGEQTRDWTNVINIVKAFYLAAITPEARNESFNIGMGERTSVNQVLDLVSKITNKELELEYVEFDKADMRDTLADISKAKRILNYCPQGSIPDAIKDFVEDYQERIKNKNQSSSF
ncbi:MAG: NAD-dependent epimerase/dehydratase family protein [Candidatus Heimdallarchaeota archaeon]|nr:NAD-dependent epimerase/dehydratase family protein [Candidatus Heimdallarchaeota archaeon]